MTQTIKPNDLVYIPHISTCIFTAQPDYGSKLCVYYGQEELDFLSNGKLAYDDVAPVVYLATPENKTKLEEFYGITLEDIPVDEEVEKFSEALNELPAFYARLSSYDGNFRPSDNVTAFVEQIEPNKASSHFYRVTFKPSVIVPDIDVRLPNSETGGNQ